VNQKLDTAKNFDKLSQFFFIHVNLSVEL